VTSGEVERHPRNLLDELIGRLREERTLSDVVAPGVDVDLVSEKLRPLARDQAVIESIAGSDERVDAVVTACGTQARVVFGHDASGLLTWIDVHLRPDRFEGLPGGRIVVVNGPSGAGKSSLMRALQSVATFPLVVLDEPEQIGTVQPGYLIWRESAPSLHRGYLAAIATLASAGNHVAVSAAGHSHEEIADALGGPSLLTVGLSCELEVLRERERRTGRWAGIAAESIGVHDGWTYDIEFDTTDGPDPFALARLVLGRIEP
jgi:chloramphenicol 3-O-phosphotransferase